MTGTIEYITEMEPMLPEEGRLELEDLAFDLAQKAGLFSSTLQPEVRVTVGNIVRSMNCYYSNLIEGHNTHPRDIDRALEDKFASDTTIRELQREARAHIEVQKMIDAGEAPKNIVSREFILWIHREFCERLPQSMLVVTNPDTKEEIEIIPGMFRDGYVSVGSHVPPAPEFLERFLARFEEAYTPERLSKVRQVVAAAAAHHRLLWIHPFFDGNGRVARLLSHAYFRQIGVGNSLWSVSRGLARNDIRYKSRLAQADEKRRSDLNGRGSLSARALSDFCKFFLEICIDQVEYMASILEPSELLRRIELYCSDEISAGNLPQGCFQLLREALLAGEFRRGKAAEISGYKDRKARSVLNTLVKKGLLISATPKAPVRLGFPLDVLERWLPKLYPA